MRPPGTPTAERRHPMARCWPWAALLCAAWPATAQETLLASAGYRAWG